MHVYTYVCVHVLPAAIFGWHCSSLLCSLLSATIWIIDIKQRDKSKIGEIDKGNWLMRLLMKMCTKRIEFS